MENESLKSLADSLRRKKISAPELMRFFFARAQSRADLNAFITLDEDAALAAAERAQKKIGEFPLAGIPVAHKDLFCDKNGRTTCGSRMLENFISPYDSFVAQKCADAGLAQMGKTNMDEFAMGSSGENSHFGATKNPWDTSRVTGGSSSGAAAATAARLSPIATCTDTGGSIRQPAAFCGVCGIKPTYGRVSRYGMVAFASGFDQGGVMAKSAEDLALALGVIAGFDSRDSTSLEEPDEDYARLLNESIEGRVIGVPRDFFGDGLDDEIASGINNAIAELEKKGATIKDIKMPSAKHGIPAYYVLTSAEASSNLSRYDGVRYGRRADAEELTEMFERSRAEGFGGEVKRRILIGTYVLSYGYYDAYYRHAQKIRHLVADDFRRIFKECEVILCPTTPSPPFALGEIIDDPVRMYMNDIYTVPVNLAGLPAMSIPCGFNSSGLPIGMQLIGDWLGEARLLNVAHQYQLLTDWHIRIPPKGGGGN